MVANIFYARSLIWGVAALYFGLVLLVCTILCNDHVWRTNQVKAACASKVGFSQLNGQNSSGPQISGIQNRFADAETLADKSGFALLSWTLRHPFELSKDFWPLIPLSDRVGTSASPCEALISSADLLEARCHAFMMVIGILGAFFLLFTGESAVQTTRFIVRDLAGEDPVPSNAQHRPGFPRLPWLYNYVSEHIKIHRRLVRQKIVRINHDMKVPLAGLRSEASELSHTVERENDSQLQTHLRSLERYVDHIDQSADQLKLVAAGRQLTLKDLSVHAICLETMIGDLVETLSLLASKRDVEIEFRNVSRVGHRTFGNKRFAEEMLMILLDIAVQYFHPWQHH